MDELPHPIYRTIVMLGAVWSSEPPTQLFATQKRVIASALCIMALAIVSRGVNAEVAEPDSLRLEAKIPLGHVAGRIDHMAIDLGRQRLFVAELGNNSVGVVDLRDRKLIRRIAGLREPQGVGYDKASDTLYVANAGDGSVRLFQGENYNPVGRIDLGDDADNIRIDPAAHQVFVGYGSGALAVIDPMQRRKTADIALNAHPEGFQLDRRSERIFINVPDARAVAVVDRLTHKQSANWSTLDAGGNFPMAIDENSDQVLVIFRHPAKLSAFSVQDGALRSSVPTCGDSDDVFVDTKRQRVYLSCGEGYLDVFEAKAGAYEGIAHIATVAGARTSLFVPELDILALAVRATPGELPAIWLYRPTP